MTNAAMSNDEAATTAARCHRALEPLHAMIYFAPENEERLTDLGLRPGRMCYFASRAAPMGAVGPGTVAATFFNFNPELVAAHIPRAWGLADRGDIIEARFAAAGSALRRMLGDVVDSEEVAEAAELAREAAESCVGDGRPLYAAHAELAWPEEPHLVLWHAVTLLREFRGDGHIAALLGAGFNGLTALVTHTATGQGFLESAAKATRGWSDEQWAETVDSLRTGGILDADGALTEPGKELRDQVENVTNGSAAAPWARLGRDKSERLRDIGKRLSHTLVGEGAFPEEIFGSRR